VAGTLRAVILTDGKFASVGRFDESPRGRLPEDLSLGRRDHAATEVAIRLIAHQQHCRRDD
jgi:hypothetical protein